MSRQLSQTLRNSCTKSPRTGAPEAALSISPLSCLVPLSPSEPTKTRLIRAPVVELRFLPDKSSRPQVPVVLFVRVESRHRFQSKQEQHALKSRSGES